MTIEQLTNQVNSGKFNLSPPNKKAFATSLRTSKLAICQEVSHFRYFRITVCSRLRSECTNGHTGFTLKIFFMQLSDQEHHSWSSRDTIPGPVGRARTTRSFTQSQPFQATLPNPRTLAHKSSFIPSTSQLWNTLSSTAFPESYNISSFKSTINKLDLIPLST